MDIVSTREKQSINTISHVNQEKKERRREDREHRREKQTKQDNHHQEHKKTTQEKKERAKRRTAHKETTTNSDRQAAATETKKESKEQCKGTNGRLFVVVDALFLCFAIFSDFCALLIGFCSRIRVVWSEIKCNGL